MTNLWLHTVDSMTLNSEEHCEEFVDDTDQRDWSVASDSVCADERTELLTQLRTEILTGLRQDLFTEFQLHDKQLTTELLHLQRENVAFRKRVQELEPSRPSQG